MENERIQEKKVFTRIGWALFTLLLTVMIVQVVVIWIINEFAPTIVEGPWYLVFMLGIPLYCVAFPIFLGIMKKIPNAPKGENKKMSFKNLIIVFIISMGSTYVFNLVGGGINMLISIIKNSDIINPVDALLGGTSIITTIIFVVILSPIIEEIIFRGLILNKLRGYGERRAIWFTALTFALFHGNLSQFFYAFALGLIFAYVVLKTNTIAYSIILHILVNLFGSVIMPGLALSGNEMLAALTGFLVIFFIVAGAILLKKNFKKIDLQAKEEEIALEVSKKVAYGNIGMIFYYLACLGLFASVIFA